MSTVRRQSIISSVVIYFGFALGLFNTYLFTRQGGFTEAQYGLTGIFIAVANIMFAISSLGMTGFISKFFPYYESNLKKEKNDMLAWSLLLPALGFALVIIAGIAFKSILIDRIFANSPELPKYYYWMFPFGFGMTIFMILETYAWQKRKAVLSNFTREVLFRFFTTTLILFTLWGVIKSFDVFIKLYSFLYILLAVVVLLYFVLNKNAYFVFKISNVTKKYFNKIVTLCSFVWGGSLVFIIANVFDTIVIAAVLPNGVAIAGIFTFAQNISSLIQAPQRAIVSASMGPLSQAWKEKNLHKINTIYHRSSINQLMFSVVMFALIWMNFDHAVYSFNLKTSFLQAKPVFLFIGLMRILDMGTGVSSQIISTSINWRFEFFTGLLLLALAMPLNYFLTQRLGIIGPPISNLIAFTIYNALRYYFLLKKYKMQPFTMKTLYAVLLALFGYYITALLFQDLNGIGWIVVRSVVFITIYATGALLIKLSPDIKPVLQTMQKKLRF
jgi:O-antigen/teichoic acid export membrane protein